jgi:hypothetical protein
MRHHATGHSTLPLQRLRGVVPNSGTTTAKATTDPLSSHRADLPTEGEIYQALQLLVRRGCVLQ